MLLADTVSAIVRYGIARSDSFGRIPVKNERSTKRTREVSPVPGEHNNASNGAISARGGLDRPTARVAGADRRPFFRGVVRCPFPCHAGICASLPAAKAGGHLFQQRLSGRRPVFSPFGLYPRVHLRRSTWRHKRATTFWEARFARIYPVYLLSLVLSHYFATGLHFGTRLAVLGMVQA
jgi:hypothetical protein